MQKKRDKRRKAVKAKKLHESCKGAENLSPQDFEALSTELDSTFFKALSAPIRIDLIKHLIAKGPLDVETIAKSFPQEYSVISRHLVDLRDADLLMTEKDGRRVVYMINGPAVISKLERLLQQIKTAVQILCPEQLLTSPQAFLTGET